MSTIPGAMLWKYGVNCSKTKDKLGIDVWESNLPKPNRDEILTAMLEHDAYLAKEKIQKPIRKRNVAAKLRTVGIEPKDLMEFIRDDGNED